MAILLLCGTPFLWVRTSPLPQNMIGLLLRLQAGFLHLWNSLLEEAVGRLVWTETVAFDSGRDRTVV